MGVSIHATLAGGDQLLIQHGSKEIVSIHATLAGGDPGAAYISGHSAVSIHATLAGGDGRESLTYTETKGFYPRHPRGWRPGSPACPVSVPLVSIHATLAGGDLEVRPALFQCHWFLSTPPSRVAT